MSASNGVINVMHLIGSTGLYGAERWILALMCAMDTKRIHSTLINLVDSEAEKSAVVHAAELRGLDSLDFNTGGKLNPLAIFQLAKLARDKQIDIIHGHGFKSDIMGLLAARLAKCHVMTTPHGWSMEQDRKLQLYETIDRFSFKFMDMVCPLSPDLMDGLHKTVGSRTLKLISNGVDIDEIQKTKPHQKKYPDSYIIGYIGQLIDRKDIPTLFSTFNILVKEHHNIKLIVLGDGAKRDELLTECKLLGIQENIDFLGFRPDAVSWLKSFDLFVLPSRLEGVPRCVMEALAASIPVVASDIHGNRDLVIHKKTGLLFPAGDSLQFAECIKYMMNNPVEAKEMATRGMLKVIKEYSNIKMATEYLSVYTNLVLK